MPTFDYTVTDRSGNRRTGRREAENSDRLVELLMDEGLYVVEIRERASKDPSSAKNRLKGLFPGRISQQEITYFYMQLSTLVGAGVTLVEALESLGDQCENPRFRHVINDIKSRISAGQTLYDSVSQHPDVFEDLSRHLIRAGETGAGLDTMLEEIARFSESDTRLRAKVKSAMVYPGVLSLMAVSIVMFMLTWVFPKFLKVFAKSKTALPGPTVFLIGVSKFLQVWWPALVAGLIGGVLLFRWLYRNQTSVRSVVDLAILRLPVFGNLAKKAAVARFCKTLGTLLQGGVPILTALEVCERIMDNIHLQQIVTEMRQGVTQGLTLYDVLRNKPLFPPMATRIIQTGEKTGALSRLLLKSGNFFEYEVEIAVQGVITLIEPMLIVTLGLVIGFIALAMFLPMFDMTKAIK